MGVLMFKFKRIFDLVSAGLTFAKPSSLIGSVKNTNGVWIQIRSKNLGFNCLMLIRCLIDALVPLS